VWQEGEVRQQNAILAVLGAALLALAAPAAAKREVAHPRDPWVHAATGTSFPAAVGAFRRGRVIEYSADGRDASVGYWLQRGDDNLTVTLYIYPTIPELNCRETFEDAQRSIEDYGGVQLLGQSLGPPPSGRGAPVARQADYLIPAGTIRADLPELRSEVYLYCPPGDQWLVKSRASWDADADFSSDVEALVRAIQWPGDLGG
jgi:hypothetical protein